MSSRYAANVDLILGTLITGGPDLCAEVGEVPRLKALWKRPSASKPRFVTTGS
jgi:hypothetical protein